MNRKHRSRRVWRRILLIGCTAGTLQAAGCQLSQADMQQLAADLNVIGSNVVGNFAANTLGFVLTNAAMGGVN